MQPKGIRMQNSHSGIPIPAQSCSKANHNECNNGNAA